MKLIPNKMRWYVEDSFLVDRKIMQIMIVDAITDSEPVTIGIIATAVVCCCVIDIVRAFYIL